MLQIILKDVENILIFNIFEMTKGLLQKFEFDCVLDTPIDVVTY
jgi:pyruvate/2-oxoglutarate/acetoin dehydrogenase E1 component